MPLSITCGATGACTIASYFAQALLPRTWRSTVNTPGTCSSFSAMSSPMRFILQPHAQVVLSGS